MKWIMPALFGIALFIVIGNICFVVFAELPLRNIQPWTVFDIATKHYRESEVQMLLAKSFGSAGLIYIFMLIVLPKIGKDAPLFGEARWATLRDIKRADPSLLGKTGIFLGQFNGRYLRQAGQSFVLVIAGTRLGKGVSIVITNCLSWKESLVVSDMKLENYAITSGFRESCGHDVYLFAPGQLKTHRWNPLDAISRDGIHTIPDIQAISSLLITSEKGNDSWVTEGKELFMAITLMLIDNPEAPLTLGEVYRQMSPEGGFAKHHKAILAGTGTLDCYHPEARRVLGTYADMAESSPKQMNGVQAFIKPTLQMFVNPLLDAATSHSDFDIGTLRKKKQTIYLGIKPQDIETYGPLLRLFYQCLVNANSTMPAQDEPYQVLLMMDEFPALGKMSSLVSAVSFIAGFNLRFVAIVQSLSQLRDIYKDQADVLQENIHTRVFFAAKNHKNSVDIANELGDMTVASKSQSKQRGSMKMGNESTSQAKRGLLLPQEAKSIGQDAMIILTDNCPPIMAKKVKYHKVGVFLDRCLDPLKKLPWRKPKSQEDFMNYVRPPSLVPELDVPSPNSINDPHGLLPEGGVTAENVAETAHRFVMFTKGNPNG